MKVKKIADRIVEKLESREVPPEYIAAFVVEDSKSFGFVQQKKKVADRLGIDFRILQIDKNKTQQEVVKHVEQTANDKKCGGIIVQLPLRKGLNRADILEVIPADKDLDVLSASSVGKFYINQLPVSPPAVEVVKEILLDVDFELSGKKVAVVGVGFLTGKPISVYLTGKVRELYVLDKGTDFKILKRADFRICCGNSY